MRDTRADGIAAVADEYLVSYVAMYPRERAAYGFFPFGGAYIGIHDGDGRVADFSPARVEQRKRELRGWRERLARLDGLVATADDGTDLAILRWVAGAEWFALSELRPHQTNPMHYNDTVDVSGYLRRRYAPFPERMAKLRDHLEAIPDALTAADDNLERALPRISLSQAIAGYAGHRTFLGNDLAALLEDLEDRALRDEVASASDAAVAALGRFITGLEARMDTAHDDFAIGETRFLGLARAFELVDLDLAALRAAGQADLDRNRALLAEACGRAYPGLSVSEAMERLSRDHPPADRLLQTARDVLGRLRDFTVGQRLVTIPEDVPPAVEETPPFHRWSFASMDSPGAFEAPDSGAHYYLTSPEPDWTEAQAEQWMRRFFRASIVNTSAHEAYPGHYVQSMHKRNAPTIAQRAFDSFTHWEGWAHGCEEIILDAGFAPDEPGQRIAQLYAALLRNARYMVAIGMHCDGMTVDEAKRVIMDATEMEELPARREAERGTFDPGYGSYTLGKLMLRKLRRDAEAEQGAGFDGGHFHDAFLAHGAPPFPIIRKRVLANDDGVLL